MKKCFLFQRLNVCFVAAFALLGLSTSTYAGITINPIELVIDGGYTFNQNVSKTTKLFVDVGGPGKANQFWVRVEDNPGIPPNLESSGDEIGPQVAIDEAGPISLTQTVSVKYFSYSRYLEVLRAVRGIDNFGRVNPYVEGFIICDLSNSTIRVWNRSVIMAYNCGSDGPDADASTFTTERLIKRLTEETVASPDFSGVIPQ